MTRIDKPMRGRRATKRLDVTDLRAVLRDRRTWNALGVVAEFDDGDSHFELVTDDDGALIDILVEVELVPDQVRVMARMSGFAGGAGAGIWSIPAIGDEVIVAIPAGQIDFQPAIVGVLSSGGIPNGGGQGPAPGRTIIVAGEVLIHDGSGGAAELAKASELNDLRSYVAGHGHPVTVAGPLAGNTTGITPLPPTDYPGTEVLKGA